MSKNKVSFSFVMVISTFVLGITIFLCMVWFKLNPTSIVQIPVVDTVRISKQKDSLSFVITKLTKDIEVLKEVKNDTFKVRDTIRVPDSIVKKHDTLKIP